MRVEVVTEPGRGDWANEDFAAAVPGAAVVADGATRPPVPDTGCTHSIAWYARTLGGFLVSAVTDPALSLTDCVAAAVEGVAGVHGGTCDLAHRHGPSATVALARVAGDLLEYLVLADSTVLIERTGGEVLAVTDDRLGELRGRIDTPPAGHDAAGYAALGRVEQYAIYRNHPEGFWVASADPAAAAQAVTGTVPLAEVETVTLLSDGATRLVDVFGALTWPGLAKVLAAEGPGGLITRTRDAEADDPAGAAFPRGKTTDDATVVRWRFDG